MSCPACGAGIVRPELSQAARDGCIPSSRFADCQRRCKSLKVVAWDGIEPPTRGFSVLIDTPDQTTPNGEVPLNRTNPRSSVGVIALLVCFAPSSSLPVSLPVR